MTSLAPGLTKRGRQGAAQAGEQASAGRDDDDDQKQEEARAGPHRRPLVIGAFVVLGLLFLLLMGTGGGAAGELPGPGDAEAAQEEVHIVLPPKPQGNLRLSAQGPLPSGKPALAEVPEHLPGSASDAQGVGDPEDPEGGDGQAGDEDEVGGGSDAGAPPGRREQQEPHVEAASREEHAGDKTVGAPGDAKEQGHAARAKALGKRHEEQDAEEYDEEGDEEGDEDDDEGEAGAKGEPDAGRKGSAKGHGFDAGADEGDNEEKETLPLKEGQKGDDGKDDRGPDEKHPGGGSEQVQVGRREKWHVETDADAEEGGHPASRQERNVEQGGTDKATGGKQVDVQTDSVAGGQMDSEASETESPGGDTLHHRNSSGVNAGKYKHEEETAKDSQESEKAEDKQARSQEGGGEDPVPPIGAIEETPGTGENEVGSGEAELHKVQANSTKAAGQTGDTHTASLSSGKNATSEELELPANNTAGGGAGRSSSSNSTAEEPTAGHGHSGSGRSGAPGQADMATPEPEPAPEGGRVEGAGQRPGVPGQAGEAPGDAKHGKPAQVLAGPNMSARANESGGGQDDLGGGTPVGEGRQFGSGAELVVKGPEEGANASKAKVEVEDKALEKKPGAESKARLVSDNITTPTLASQAVDTIKGQGRSNVSDAGPVKGAQKEIPDLGGSATEHMPSDAKEMAGGVTPQESGVQLASSSAGEELTPPPDGAQKPTADDKHPDDAATVEAREDASDEIGERSRAGTGNKEGPA